MRQSTRKILGEQKNILEIAGQLFQNIDIKVTKSIVNNELVGGVLRAGTIVDLTGKKANTAALASKAVGIVYHDVDFNDSKGTEVVPITVFGFIKKSVLPEVPVNEVLPVLKMIMFL